MRYAGHVPDLAGRDHDQRHHERGDSGADERGRKDGRAFPEPRVDRWLKAISAPTATVAMTATSHSMTPD
jgi:hypothetical protein